MEDIYLLTEKGKEWRLNPGFVGRDMSVDPLRYSTARDLWIAYVIEDSPHTYEEIVSVVGVEHQDQPLLRPLGHSEIRESLRRLYEAGYMDKAEQ